MLLLFVLQLSFVAATRYYYNENKHAYVGWNRGDDPGCVATQRFVSGETHGKPDDVQVTICEGAITRPEPANHQLVSCVAPLYGPLDTEWLASWCLHHIAIGVDHFEFYGIDRERPVLPGVPSYAWNDASWQFHNKRTHERGQLWAMHDCLYKSHARNDRWAIFTDVDEWVFSPTSLLEITRKLADGGFDALKIPQTVRDHANDCSKNFTEWAAHQQTLKINHNHAGHKSLVDVQRVGRLNVHQPTGAQMVQSNHMGLFLMHDRCLRMHFGKHTGLDPQ